MEGTAIAGCHDQLAYYRRATHDEKQQDHLRPAPSHAANHTCATAPGGKRKLVTSSFRSTRTMARPADLLRSSGLSKAPVNRRLTIRSGGGLGRPDGSRHGWPAHRRAARD